MWRLFTTDRHMRSQDRDIRGDKVVSRTADTTNKREGATEMNKVVIEVKGGVAWVAQQPENIEVEIIDYDNLEVSV